MFAIIDIETTGGSPKTEKITEIAIYVHDGLNIVDEFVSLINPEVTIPYFITGLTGITNEMVADAPRFFEVAKTIVEKTEGMVFVAHNVHFDYSFIRNEFKSLGYEYHRKTLDTVRLARRIIPGLPSYSLGKLCKQLGIPLDNRHRASGDALATVRLFEYLLSADQKKQAGKLVKPAIPQGLSEFLTKKVLKKLPDDPGVYYFWDKEGELIYVGKSINIRQRVFQHLHNQSTRRSMEMKNQLADITWELTGNELIALLLESDEIKKHKPKYNRAQRRNTFHYGLYEAKNKDGYLLLSVAPTSKDGRPLTTFSSKREGRELLTRWVEEYALCQKFCGLYESDGPCFHAGIGECKGACVGKESPETYNERVMSLTDKFAYAYQDFLILEKGRVSDEIAIVCIEKGQYRGFGFAPADHQKQVDLLLDCIRYYPDNRDIHALIKLYLRKNEVHTIPINGEFNTP